MSRSFSRFFLLTGGKGGSGRTPIALMLSAALYEGGRNVILLDLNFSNPDAFFIATKIVPRQYYFLGEKFSRRVEVLEGGGVHPIRVYDVLESGRNFFKAAARVENYLYTPITPRKIFESLDLLKRRFRDVIVDVVVDTNLNLPSLKPRSEDDYSYIRRVLNWFGDYKVLYIWNPGTLARSVRVGDREVSEVETILDTVNEYRIRGVDLFGEYGERIVHIVTPNLYERLDKSVFEKIYSFLNWAIKLDVPKDVEVVKHSLKTRDYLKEIVKAISMMQLRREGYMNIEQLREISRSYREEIERLIRKTPDYGADAKSITVVHQFFNIFLEKMIRVWERIHPIALLPRNVIIIPYMVEKMVNYVEALLTADAITLDTIRKRAKEISDILRNWIGSEGEN